MSEQVKPQLVWLPDGLGGGEHVHVYRATDYDALHAEAEALRAALFGIASVNPAERGIEWAKSYASDGLKGAGSELYARWLETFKEAEALRAENAKLRTTLAEQGERQEAVVYAVHAKGAQVDHHCPLVSPDMAADYLSGCATPLYTTPQPSQDVQHGDGDLTLTPAAQAILTECIGAHAYVLQAIVNGRPDLALTEAKKWVDGFKQAADHHRQAQRQA